MVVPMLAGMVLDYPCILVDFGRWLGVAGTDSWKLTRLSRKSV
jgi:hypothetical protein